MALCFPPLIFKILTEADRVNLVRTGKLNLTTESFRTGHRTLRLTSLYSYWKSGAGSSVKKPAAPCVSYLQHHQNFGTGNNTPPKISHAKMRVQTILNAWAMRNTAAGFPPPIDMRSLNWVSRPMHRNASVNHQPLKPAVIPVTALRWLRT